MSQNALRPRLADLALVTYLAPILQGRRVAVAGTTSGEVAQRLRALGAHTVVCFGGVGEDIAVRALTPGSIAGFHGKLDILVVPDATAVPSLVAVLDEARRALGSDGVVVVGAEAPNGPRVMEPTGRDGTTAYHDLYDLCAARFANVRMVGRGPFVGYTLATFDDGSDRVALDTRLIDGDPARPESFIAVASDSAVALDPMALVQVPDTLLESLREAGVRALREQLQEREQKLKEVEAASAERWVKIQRFEHGVKELEDENRKAREKVVRATKELIRNLAHEIKNPLGGIRGAAQLLGMELAHSRELAEYTQVIVQEADRLQVLVDRLLAPHRKPHLVGDVNIHEVLERVRALILAEFPRGLEVVRDYDISIPEFRGDREQLIQAVLNIVHNAAQALAERRTAGDARIVMRSRIARQVTLGKQRWRLALDLHIEDNGPGIPESIRDRIFYPLVSGRDGGSGLGLTLAQTFVQQHQGTIECESEPGRTVFKIIIPLP